MFLTLQIALLLRGNLLPGATWGVVIDVALVIINTITPIFFLWLLVLRTDMNKVIVKSIRRYVRCCIQLSFPSVQEHEEENSVVHDLTPAAVDAHVVLPLPSTIFQFHHHHHHQPSNVKVHIAPSSKIPSSIEPSPSGLPALFPEGVEVEQNETDTFDASARTALLRPMETTIDPGSRTGTPLRRRSSIQEHLIALRVSGNELVDRLRTSGTSRESGYQPWTS